MKSTSLPKSLHRYFWDIEAKKLNPQKRPQYVIQRLLEMGDQKAIRWLRKNFSKTQIITTLKERRGFSTKAVNFWSVFYKIPKQKIKSFQISSCRKSHPIWPY